VRVWSIEYTLEYGELLRVGPTILGRPRSSRDARPYLETRKWCRKNLRTGFQRWQKGDGLASAGHDD